MKVILHDDIPKLGARFETVEVAVGYARNFLIPRGLAVEANDSSLKQLGGAKQAAQRKEKAVVNEAERWAQRISETELNITVPAGESGRVHQAVTNREIAERLKNELDFDIDRHDIELDQPITTLGAHTIPVHLHRYVKAQLRVNVVGQQTSDEAAE